LSALERVTAGAFGQRRKMLRSSLSSVFGPDTVAVLESVGVDPSARGETLSVAQFLTLADALHAR
jgi:16S rRNA (adenine1518-N6/adenine1519-N6)-dimethyltransferase